MPRPSGIVHRPSRASRSEDAAVDRARRGSAPRRSVGLSRPLATFSVVLLPAPFGPSSAYTVPGGIVMFTPCSTSMLPYAACTSMQLDGGTRRGRAGRGGAAAAVR